jgi:hypothetical protein
MSNNFLSQILGHLLDVNKNNKCTYTLTTLETRYCFLFPNVLFFLCAFRFNLYCVGFILFCNVCVCVYVWDL